MLQGSRKRQAGLGIGRQGRQDHAAQTLPVGRHEHVDRWAIAGKLPLDLCKKLDKPALLAQHRGSGFDVVLCLRALEQLGGFGLERLDLVEQVVSTGHDSDLLSLGKLRRDVISVARDGRVTEMKLERYRAVAHTSDDPRIDVGALRMGAKAARAASRAARTRSRGLRDWRWNAWLGWSDWCDWRYGLWRDWCDWSDMRPMARHCGMRGVELKSYRAVGPTSGQRGVNLMAPGMGAYAASACHGW